MNSRISGKAKGQAKAEPAKLGWLFRLAKSHGQPQTALTTGKRLVLPAPKAAPKAAPKGTVTTSLLIKSHIAFESGAITGGELNLVDLLHRQKLRIEDAELLAKIEGYKP